jgi:hypothetical protein
VSRRWLGTLAAAATATATICWLAYSPTWSSGSRLLVILVAVGAHAATTTLARREHVLGRRTVLAVAGVLLVVAVFVPPRDSNDLWGYVSYARVLSVHHENPYRDAPSNHPDDPMLERMSAEYRTKTTIYGPAFTVVSAAGTSLTGASPLANRLFFQGLAALMAVVALVLVDRRTRGDPGALAFFGLSPLVVAIVNGAHTDLIIGVLLLAAIVLVEDDREVAGGLAIAGALLIKVVAILPAAALGVWVWRNRDLRASVRLAAVAVPIALAAYLAVGGMATLDPVREAAEIFGSRGQAWEAVRQAWSDSYAARGLVEAADTAHLEVSRLALPIMLAMALVVLIRLTYRRDPAVPVAGAGLGFLLSAVYVLPWYSGWVLPPAASVWRSPVATLAQIQAGLVFLVYADPPGTLPPEGPLLDLETRWLPVAGIALAVAFVTWAFISQPSPTPASTGRERVSHQE